MLADYAVKNDKFETHSLRGGGKTKDDFAFPCNVCRHNNKVASHEPCRMCGHNVNAEIGKDGG